MNPLNAVRLALLVQALMSLAACGGNDAADGGPGDAGRRDDGTVDAAVCPDVDGDGHGAAPCGDDCDDTAVAVNPDATEICNGGIDDDCDGDADGADDVCVPCRSGYVGVDGNCEDLDECVAEAPCGALGATCVNTVGSYICTCPAGYSAPASGGTCADVDECARLAPCGVLATGCVNTIGSYACSCLPGYGAPVVGGACADLDECAVDACGVGATGCTNSVGSYTCACGAGYDAPPTGGSCVDADECATGTPCGTGRGVCTNVGGSYACACNAGYDGPATGGTCTEVDECARGTDDCDREPVALCANTPGSFTCGCPADFTGAGHGLAGCVRADPSLSALDVSAGALDPPFAAAETMYAVTLAPGAAIAITPSVAYPTHATITVDGVTVASGASTPFSLALSFAPRPVVVTVTTDSGATRTYTIVVSRALEYVKASNAATEHHFGHAVALSGDGSTLAVGADQEDSSGGAAGAVYVYARAGGTWSQQAYLRASNAGSSDQFGQSIALSADGSTLAVGADGESSSATGIGGDQTDNSAFGSGAVYVFTRAGTAWSQQAYVKASNTGTQDQFGAAVALSADGSTLAVGAEREGSSATGIGGDQTSNSANAAGAVYVYKRVGTAWSQRAYVKASNTGANDLFGTAVALSANGSILAVSAIGEASYATGIGGIQTVDVSTYSGAVYVYSLSGTTWSQQAYVKASNTGPGDMFGYSVALSSDGSTLAVGAIVEGSDATGIGGDQTNNDVPAAGAVYVFRRTGTVWSQEAYVKASNTDAQDFFGWSVALSADGSALCVGASRESSAATGIGGDQSSNAAGEAGAVYLYRRAGTTWSQDAYIKASNTDAGDQFGRAVALSGDGSTLAVGAPIESSSATGIGGDQTSNAAPGAGAVFLY